MHGELTAEEIDEVLRQQTLGRIGCQADGRVDIVPIGYVYDGDSVYSVSGEGRKLQVMRRNPRVCFEVEEIHHWTNWRTVIAWGRFEELAGGDAARASELVHARMTPLMEFERKLGPPGVAEGPMIAYRIVLEERRGRIERL